MMANKSVIRISIRKKIGMGNEIIFREQPAISDMPPEIGGNKVNRHSQKNFAPAEKRKKNRQPRPVFFQFVFYLPQMRAHIEYVK